MGVPSLLRLPETRFKSSLHFFNCVEAALSGGLKEAT
jgi:hypothetical protein